MGAVVIIPFMCRLLPPAIIIGLSLLHYLDAWIRILVVLINDHLIEVPIPFPSIPGRLNFTLFIQFRVRFLIQPQTCVEIPQSISCLLCSSLVLSCSYTLCQHSTIYLAKHSNLLLVLIIIH